MAYWVYRPEPHPIQRPPRVPPSALVTGDQPPRRSNALHLSLVARQWPEDKTPYPAQIRRDYIVPFTTAPVVDQPPSYSVAKMMSIIGQWPEDKEPRLNPRPSEGFIAPQTLVYGQQPPPASRVNYGTIVTGWQPSPNLPVLENQNAAWNSAPLTSNPPPATRVNMLAILGAWSADKAYPAQQLRVNIAPFVNTPAVNNPPPKSADSTMRIINAWSQSQAPHPSQFWYIKIAPFVNAPVVNQPPRRSNAQYLSIVGRQWPLDKEPRREVFARIPSIFPGAAPPVVVPDRLSEAIKEAYASAPTGVIVIHTLEFRHPNFMDDANQPVAIRAVLGHDSLEARLEDDAPQNPGQYVTFIPMAFELELPNVEHLAMPEIGISIDNVSREIEDNLTIAAASPYPVEVTYRPYLNTDLTQPQMNPPLTMTLISAEADDFKVTARATYGNAANVLCPRESYTTARFPGIQR